MIPIPVLATPLVKELIPIAVEPVPNASLSVPMAVVASPIAAVFAYFPFTLMEAEPNPPGNLVSISLLKLFLIPFPAFS